YAHSPFSEKIRLGLGLKNLPWQSVTLPPIMPKPDLMPLTGGYRKTPVLQIGADIYCDTELIMRVLERQQPTPSFHAGSDPGTCGLLAWSIERSIFAPAVALAFAAIGDMIPAAFIEDREKFSGRRIDVARLRADRPLFVDQLRPQLDWLSKMLADGRPYLLGSAPTSVDLAAYHPIWFMRSLLGADAAAAIPGVALLLPWADRIAAIGHGRKTDLSSASGLEIARDAEPEAVPPDTHDASEERLPGARISVTPDDTGRDPVSGILVAASAQEIILAREEPALGRVHVHFPRAGFVITG
ncbi:MAG: glutathione S-transferase, partial [Aliidongia sp.]